MSQWPGTEEGIVSKKNKDSVVAEIAAVHKQTEGSLSDSRWQLLETIRRAGRSGGVRGKVGMPVPVPEVHQSAGFHGNALIPH